MKKVILYCLMFLFFRDAAAQYFYNNALFGFKNMPGENEIEQVAQIDYQVDYFTDSIYRCEAFFGGYGFENNHKELFVGRFRRTDSSVIWSKLIAVDSFINVAGVARITPATIDTPFIICFNVYDTVTHKTKIGAMRIRKDGVVDWTQYYASATSDLFAKSFAYTQQYGYVCGGYSKYPAQTKALMMTINPGSGTATANELVFNNSDFQEIQDVDRSRKNVCIGGEVYTSGISISGIYNNGAFGLDWFVYQGGNIRTAALPGDQTEVKATRTLHICNEQSRTHIWYRTDSNKVSMVEWYLPYYTDIYNMGTFPNTVHLKQVVNTLEEHTFGNFNSTSGSDNHTIL